MILEAKVLKKAISTLLLIVMIMIFGSVEKAQAAPGWVEALDFSEGLAAVKIDQKWGFIDKTGATVIKPQYDDAWPFCDGLAKISLNGKWGFIDTKGTLIIEPKFYEVGNFGNGFAKVILNGKKCFIDKTGAVLNTPNVNILSGFENGFASVSLNSMYGFIDKTGAMVIPPKYDDLGKFNNGLCSMKVNGQYGFIDQKGKVVIPPQFTFVKEFSENLAVVSIGGKYGYINTNGNMAILPQFEGADSFSEGLAAIESGNKYGFVNKSGTIVIPAKYDAAGSFQEGVAAIKVGDKWSFIDKMGNVIVSPQYFSCVPCGEGLVIAEKEGRYGYFNNVGAAVIPVQLDGAFPFSDGWARVYFNGRYDFVDKFGQFLSERISSDNTSESGIAKAALEKMQRAQIFIDKKQYDEAIEIANTVIAADLANDIAYTLLGQAYMGKKDYYQAKTNFEKALAINPNASTNKGFLNECKFQIANQKEEAQRIQQQRQQIQQANEEIIEQIDIGKSVVVLRWQGGGYSGVIREINNPYLALEITDFYKVTEIPGGPATGGEALLASRDVGKIINIEARYLTHFGKFVRTSQEASSSSNGGSLQSSGSQILNQNNAYVSVYRSSADSDVFLILFRIKKIAKDNNFVSAVVYDKNGNVIKDLSRRTRGFQDENNFDDDFTSTYRGHLPIKVVVSFVNDSHETSNASVIFTEMGSYTLNVN